MSKQVSNGELSEIVSGLLVGHLGPQHLDSTERYSRFMTELAQLICDHCGGVVSDEMADNSSEQWLIGINSDDRLPDDGGVWKDYDPDGELEDSDPDEESKDCAFEPYRDLRNCKTELPASEQRLPTAVVWIEGGVVQWVASDFPMQYLILDADTDGNDCMEVTMENGSLADVIRTPSTLFADCLPAWVSNLVEEVERQ